MVYALPPGSFDDGLKLLGLVGCLIEVVGYWWNCLEKPISNKYSYLMVIVDPYYSDFEFESERKTWNKNTPMIFKVAEIVGVLEK